ncbi:lytic murein transglycosylase, partial [Candidatus Parcubacteria bacterium]|nr:lytic murein transglycosylase [Candidatus Parcubacteria bacterium]
MNFRRTIFGIATILITLFSVSYVLAADLDCNLPENRETCLAELAKTEAEITNLNKQLSGLKNEGASIARDKAILENQAKQAKLKIKTHELSIAKLGKDIKSKESAITGLQERINKNKVGLNEVIRNAYEVDNISAVEIFLANENISDFFRDLDAYVFINTKIRESIGIISKDKTEEETEKKQLDETRSKEYDSKYAVEAEKAKIEKINAEKARLLSLNKKEQVSYNGIIVDKQKKATQIRNALFALRDSGSIKFEDAVAFAKSAGNLAGVRPAFILAILQQESNLGSNVGSCYMTNVDTGAGVKISSGAAVNNVMKPSRDVQPFLVITKALGKDPFTTRVSCPFTTGYGGAMGPAQFIPSTWQLFANRISKAKGGATANPWA